jgi:DNA-binding SARP family transcriptional activator/tetratricopeptide (TPR) repeat protein
VEVRLFGPVELWSGYRQVDLGNSRRRCLFAVLAMTPGQHVAMDALIDRVWGDQPPAAPRDVLYSYMSRLRAALTRADPAGEHAALRRGPSGYLLDIDLDRVDLHRFRRLASEASLLAGRGRDGDEQAGALLMEASSLWRAAPLAGLSGQWAERVRHGLARERLTMLTERFEVELRLGRHSAVIGPLSDLLSSNPTAEPLAGLLMMALYRCGRQSEALEVYARIRRCLVEEIGDGPGTALRRLHQQVLRHDPVLDHQHKVSQTQPESPEVTPPSPRATDRPDPGEVRSGGRRTVTPVHFQAPLQLPADPTTFTGRDRELAWISGLLGQGRSTMTTVAIYGPAGVGKSTLALHTAHQLAGRFRDGVLYADLYGATVAAPPAPPLGVLARFLRTLGVPGTAVATDLEEASALFRSLLADRQVLLVLDNAADVAQVRPLLPAGPECGAIVTSRKILGALDSAHHLELKVLDPGAAVTLLTELAGKERVAEEPSAAATLAKRCAYLPLALRLAGARLATRPAWPVRALSDRLADERGRLDELQLGDLAVRTSFQVSYQALADSSDPPDVVAARIFRRLGLLNVPDINAAVAAAVDDKPLPLVESALERLVDTQLLTSLTLGRYYLHDLLRLFAREQLASHETQGERDTAMARALAHYLATARRAAKLHNPADPRADGPQDQALPLDTRPDALTWLEAERLNILAVARQACAHHTTAATGLQLASAVFRYLDYHGYWQELIELNHAVLDGAELIGDRSGAAQAHNDLGGAYARLRDLTNATTHLHSALSIRRELGDHQGAGASLNNLGIVHRNQGQLPEAIAAFEESLTMRRQVGDRNGEAHSMDNLGQVWLAMRCYEQAVACQEQGLAIVRETGDRQTEGLILANLAETCREAGDPNRALDLAQQSVAVCGEWKSQVGEAFGHRAVGNASLALGRPEDARTHWQMALDLLERSPGLPLVSDLRTLLDNGNKQL